MEYENNQGESDEWYTPHSIFESLGCVFDLDPCSPGVDHWVPARNVFTIHDDGLSQEWGGFVFMNPPFGKRLGQVPWLKKFLKHRNGIAIVRAYTSASWFHEFATQGDSFVFPKGKTKFIRPDGTVGKRPGGGVVLIGCGDRATEVLKASNLGWCVQGTV